MEGIISGPGLFELLRDVIAFLILSKEKLIISKVFCERTGNRGCGDVLSS